MDDQITITADDIDRVKNSSSRKRRYYTEPSRNAFIIAHVI